MYNRCVKFGLKIPNRLGKNVRKPQGRFFFDSHRTLTMPAMQRSIQSIN